jgi:hypothetical protein
VLSDRISRLETLEANVGNMQQSLNDIVRLLSAGAGAAGGGAGLGEAGGGGAGPRSNPTPTPPHTF